MSGRPDSQFVHSWVIIDRPPGYSSVSFHSTISGIFCRDGPTANACPSFFLFDRPLGGHLGIVPLYGIGFLFVGKARQPMRAQVFFFSIDLWVISSVSFHCTVSGFFLSGRPDSQFVHSASVSLYFPSLCGAVFLFSLVGEGLEPPETVAIGSAPLVTDQLRERQDAPLHLSFPHLGSLSPTPTFSLQFHIISLMI